MSGGPGKSIVLYGPRGEELARPPEKAATAPAHMVVRTASSLLTGTTGFAAFGQVSSLKSFHTHPWVYAASMTVAAAVASVPFQILRDTKGETDRRRESVRRSGGRWSGPKAGRARTAIARRSLWAGRERGLRFRDAEPVHDLPLAQVLTNPNPPLMSSQAALWSATALWMFIRGEAMWVNLNADGSPVRPGHVPEVIILVSPDSMREIIYNNRLIGWRWSVRRGEGADRGWSLALSVEEVTHYKFYNPSNPIRGLSPFAAAAGAIEMDVMSTEHSKAVLRNGANPGGVFVDKSQTGLFSNPDETRKFQEDLEARYSGAMNAGRSLVLPNGLEYVRVSMTPQDMQDIERRGWDRDEILAVARVPKSCVSVTDDINFATAISQDRNLWRGCVIPLLRVFEAEFDSSYLNTETDDLFGAFDLSMVEGLRAGLADQLNMVKVMCGPEIHAPPNVAFETVGLDAPEYEHNDTCLISPMLAPVDDVVSGLALPGPTGPGQPGADPGAPDPGSEPGAQDDTPTPVGDGPAGKALARTVIARGSEVQKGRDERYWAAIVKQLNNPQERLIIPRYKGMVSALQRAQTARFDQVARGKDAGPALTPEEIERILLPLQTIQAAVGGALRPAFSLGLEPAYQFTVEVDMGGMALFQIDDPGILDVIEKRTNLVKGRMAPQIQRGMRQSLKRGVESGETISQLRDRVGEFYGTQGSPAKTLMVARTEAAGFINSARDEMFKQQGFAEEAWLAAGDEAVRKSHVIYGEAGAKPRDFDYLTIRPADLPSVAGRLRFPSDPEGPASEVINCRCCKRPTK